MAEELLESRKDLDQEQRHSQLPEDLKRLVDEEEQYRRIKEDAEKARTQPMGTDDTEGLERTGKVKYKIA
ncbi:hypothetical protein ASPSYDRAFT_94778 [Aspergillus sydowii CBS 593.65]|uniref:Uncharacterized protein n=1 Tax=Aspergillus sydowii CBS 593.65 TaxID=1036612 RepID=A0A1L9T2D4_9EURO|nr:uncharacterized protein ASPSYDRAFT_94778 [Aspergillus sydowii CBS 593.65]OJJ53578.1 hypothetical protein ASPSYDRAFT_94778 [Aspergillus sydowii CBS 593.65]